MIPPHLAPPEAFGVVDPALASVYALALAAGAYAGILAGLAAWFYELRRRSVSSRRR